MLYKISSIMSCFSVYCLGSNEGRSLIIAGGEPRQYTEKQDIILLELNQNVEYLLDFFAKIFLSFLRKSQFCWQVKVVLSFFATRVVSSLLHRFICKSCSKCVCVFCTHTSHKGHDLMSILEGTESCKQEIDETMQLCNTRIDSLSNQLHFIQVWEQCYNQTKEHILSTAAGFLNQVSAMVQNTCNSQ